jgi:hypothetical protein
MNCQYNFRSYFLTMATIFGIFLVVDIFEMTYAEDDNFVNDMISTQMIVILLYSYYYYKSKYIIVHTSSLPHYDEDSL